MKTFKEYLTESEGNSISVYDVDDTLLFTDSRIKYKEPGANHWKSVGTDEFAEIRDKLPKGTDFDFSAFREFDQMYVDLRAAKPRIKLWKQLDKDVKAGRRIGILTARGNQRAVLIGLKSILRWKDDEGNLRPIPKKLLRKKYTFAINDEKTLKALKGVIGGDSSVARPEEMKALVLKHIFADKMGFKKVLFYDDDVTNIKAVNNLADTRIKAIHV